MISNFKKLGAIMLMALTIAVWSSCKDNSDDPSGCASEVDALTQLVSDIQDKSLAYATDPTNANCLDYKAAMNEFLDEFPKSRDCMPADAVANFDAAVPGYTAAINALPC